MYVYVPSLYVHEVFRAALAATILGAWHDIIVSQLQQGNCCRATISGALAHIGQLWHRFIKSEEHLAINISLTSRPYRGPDCCVICTATASACTGIKGAVGTLVRQEKLKSQRVRQQ